MKTIRIRGMELGAGAPKVAVPIIGATQDEILKKAREISAETADLVEWRADCYCDATQPDKLLDTLQKLRAALGGLPLLFTLRTRHDGGGIDLDDGTYTMLNESAAQSGCADLVDVEIYRDAELLRRHIAALKRHVAVIGSSHDFHATPTRGQMVALLCKARELGADVSKLAVMPQTGKDVLALLDASAEMRERYADQPIITISMGQLGVVSRIACETTGSCITFGAVGQVSAPGQIPAGELKRMLALLHTEPSTGAEA